MTDSALVMTSMTYDLRCEMFRFAWRNIRFVFPAFWADRGQNEMKPERAVFGWNRHREEAEGRRGDPGAARRRRFLDRHALSGSRRRERLALGAKAFGNRSLKNLRESAANILK
jgi:hypothetical protein